MSLPEPKSVASLTKKAYYGMCEYIVGNTSPENAQMILDLMTEAMRATTGFDPNAKMSPELCKRTIDRRKQNLEKEGVTQYEKYIKPRYERLKEQFPTVSTHELLKHPTSVLQKMTTSC